MELVQLYFLHGQRMLYHSFGSPVKLVGVAFVDNGKYLSPSAWSHFLRSHSPLLFLTYYYYKRLCMGSTQILRNVYANISLVNSPNQSQSIRSQ